MDEFLKQFRSQYSGAYDDMSDADLAAAIHRRYYSDMQFDEFVARVSAKHGAAPAQRPMPGEALRLASGAYPVEPGTAPSSGDVLRLGLQAVPLVGEWSDEVLGDTERVNELRGKYPWLAIGSELAGAAIPVGGGAKLMGMLANPFRKVAAGAALGLGAGLTEGMGMAQGGPIERAASVPAIAGALLGGVGGAVGSVVQGVRGSRRFASEHQQQVRGALLRETGVPENAAREAGRYYRANRARMQRLYDAVGKEFERVETPEARAFVAQIRAERPHLIKALNIGDDNVASFEQLKRMRQRLTRRDPDASEVLTGIIDRATAQSLTLTNDAVGSFRGLSEAYARNERERKVFRLGRSSATKDAYDIEMARPSGDNADLFRQGQVSKASDMLGRRNEEASQLLRQYMDAGPAGLETMRTLFPPGEAGETAFRSFLNVLERDRARLDQNDAFLSLLRFGRSKAGAVSRP